MVWSRWERHWEGNSETAPLQRMPFSSNCKRLHDSRRRLQWRCVYWTCKFYIRHGKMVLLMSQQIFFVIQWFIVFCCFFGGVVDIIGNGRGGESIYGGFFEGKEATVKAISYYPNWLWLQDVSTIFFFFPQTKALQSNTTRSTCCQWPIGVKIRMDPSFSCKQHLFLPVINLVHY